MRFRYIFVQLILLLVLFPLLTFAQNVPYIPLASANYSIVEQTTEVIVHKNGQAEEQVTNTLQALSDKGRVEISLAKFRYKSASESITVTNASLTTGNLKVAIPVSKITDKAMATDKFGVTDEHEIVVPFDGVQLNSKVSYTLLKKTLVPSVPGLYTLFLAYGIGAPEQNSIIRIKSEIPLYIQIADPDNNLQTIQTQQGLWQVTEIRMKSPIYGIREEDLSNPKLSLHDLIHVPRVSISSTKTWKQLSELVQNQYLARLSEALPLTLQTFLKSIPTTATTATKISLLREWINTNITYSGKWDTSFSRWTPRSLDKIVNEKVGDCKDLALLFIRMAQELGIKANFSFVSIAANSALQKFLYAPIDPADPLPSTSYFDHAVVRVSDGLKSYFVDPTMNLAQGEATDYHLNQAPVWVLGADASGYTKIPINESKDSQIESSVTQMPDGLLVKSKINLNGSLAQFFQTILKSNNPELLNRSLSTIAGFPDSEQIKLVKSLPNDAKTPHLEYEIEFFNRHALIKKDGKQGLKYYSSLPALYWASAIPGSQMPFFYYRLTKYTSIQGLFARKEQTGDCLLRGPLFNSDRIVQNLQDRILITDTGWGQTEEINEASLASDPMQIVATNVKQAVACLSADLEIERRDGQNKTQLPFEQNAEAVIKKIPTAETWAEDVYGKWRALNYLINKGDKSAENYAKLGNAFYAIATVNFEQGEPAYNREARGLFKKALEIDPKNIRALVGIGLIDVAEKKENDALITFHKAYAIKPNGPPVFYLAGDIARLQKNKDSAIGYFRLAESDDEYRKKAILGQIEAYCADIKNCPKAIPLFAKYLKVANENAWSLHNVACYYLRMTFYKEAIDYERKALAKMEFGRGREGLMRALANRSIELASREPITHALPKQSDVLEAEKLVSEAAGIDSNNVEVTYALARVAIAKSIVLKDPTFLIRVESYIAKLNSTKPAFPGNLLADLRDSFGAAKILSSKGNRGMAETTQLNSNFETLRKKSEDLLTTQGGKEYDESATKQLGDQSIMALKRCGFTDGENIDAIAEIDPTGKVTSWSNQFAGVDTACLQQAMLNAQVSSPPQAPFYLHISFRIAKH